MIGERHWAGGYHYILNLLRAIDIHVSDRIAPHLFVGNDIPDEDTAPFRELQSLEIVQSPIYNTKRSRYRLANAILFGIDYSSSNIFQKNMIDIVFEAATFYGWRFHIPTIAWIPDFQHRHLPNLFDWKTYWRRELGFKTQIIFGRQIMLSSDVARKDCEQFYPSTKGRTSVVRFAVLPDSASINSNPAEVIREYNLPEQFFYMPNQFWKHKNHKVVIEALDVLRQAGHSVVVVATGKPEDPRHPRHFEDLELLVCSRGLEHNFRILGMVPRQHVVSLMRTCIALINPSLFEGWSTSVEEAKSFGVPMLLSDISVHREQAENYANFFKPESYEQLASLMLTQKPLPFSSHKAREMIAIKESEKRVRQFAVDFSSMLDKKLFL